jgi:hypothetical protein
MAIAGDDALKTIGRALNASPVSTSMITIVVYSG